MREVKMKPFLPTLIFSALVFSGATYAASMDSDTVMVGGAAMYPSKNIVENAVNSKDHTTLVAAVKAAGLVPTLEGKGPFTVFAPTNAAMAAAGTSPKSTMARRMSYLIVPGKYDSQALLRVISEGGGQAKLRTAEGGMLIARMNGPTNIVVMDEKGNTADIAIYDVRDKNGIIHVVDRALEPGGPARQMASN